MLVLLSCRFHTAQCQYCHYHNVGEHFSHSHKKSRNRASLLCSCYCCCWSPLDLGQSDVGTTWRKATVNAVTILIIITIVGGIKVTLRNPLCLLPMEYLGGDRCVRCHISCLPRQIVDSTFSLFIIICCSSVEHHLCLDQYLTSHRAVLYSADVGRWHYMTKFCP